MDTLNFKIIAMNARDAAKKISVDISGRDSSASGDPTGATADALQGEVTLGSQDPPVPNNLGVPGSDTFSPTDGSTVEPNAAATSFQPVVAENVNPDNSVQSG